MSVLEILESNLKTAEAERDTRAVERIRRNIEFLKSRAKLVKITDCTEQNT